MAVGEILANNEILQSPHHEILVDSHVRTVYGDGQ
jgi:hypothetical protein